MKHLSEETTVFIAMIVAAVVVVGMLAAVDVARAIAPIDRPRCCDCDAVARGLCGLGPGE